MAAEFHLRATPSAAKAVEGLRGDAKKAYERLLPQLKAQGCKVAGYRLLAADGALEGSVYSEFCCKPLTGAWRLILSFEASVVWIVAVGRHDGEAFYRDLSENYDVSKIGQGRDQKPACCGDAGWPTLGKNRAQKRVRASS